MNLVIVESPTKARTLTRFLGKHYRVEASMGHIRDLPKETLGVDIEHDFKPEYVVNKDKQGVVRKLKGAAAKADEIILATDPDREGEAIAYHLIQVISKSSKFKVQSSKLLRIVFHEITRSAVEEALKQPRQIDRALFDAQQARRILDRLVGYKLSPLLWRKVRRGLSAGRVQSVAVRLVVEREREIEKFVKENYWRISSKFKVQSSKLRKNERELEAELVEIEGSKVEKRETLKLFDGNYTVVKTILTSQAEVGNLVEDIKKYDYLISLVEKKEIKRFPPPPLTTSTLQQTAGRLFGFTAKRTMRTAQRLYEQGLITYHRTDSLNLAEKFLKIAAAFIKKQYGQEYGLTEPRRFKTRSKVAQEAHEAIRPTNLDIRYCLPDRQAGGEAGILDIGKDKRGGQNEIVKGLNRDERRIYELVWKRAVASQMARAVFDRTIIRINSKSEARNPKQIQNSNDQNSKLKINSNIEIRNPKQIQNSNDQNSKQEAKYLFQTFGSVIKFDGFLKVLGRGFEDKILPAVKMGEDLKVKEVEPSQHQTTPPPRYSEAALVKTLEKEGIGRPSTYAPIISTIQARQYVEKVEGRFEPTNLGTAVNDFLVANFSGIVNIPFTAKMENDLDKIANGQVKWAPVMKDFYGPFEKKLAEVAEKAVRVEVAVEETKEKCSQCGGKLVVRIGRFGKFLACSNFPKCKFTKNLVEKTGLKCPKCGGEVVVKKTKKGKRFYGCANYPKCKFAAWKREQIKRN